jgi:triosephosphate isomerase (TIM)
MPDNGAAEARRQSAPFRRKGISGMSPRRPLVAGNWKMNGLRGSLPELSAIIEGARQLANVDLMVCPPATLLVKFAKAAAGTAVRIGAQDCHSEPKGAFTGDLSAEMLKDAGATAVILGHSERRTRHGETDAQVRAKASAARRAGLLAIICVGETKEDREKGKAEDVVATQLRGSLPNEANAESGVIAYEPVWAIGTGVTPTPAEIAQMHTFLRAQLNSQFGAAGEDIRILYGGSVTPSNARELMHVANVDGALVGGASLRAVDFLAIATVCGHESPQPKK